MAYADLELRASRLSTWIMRELINMFAPTRTLLHTYNRHHHHHHHHNHHNHHLYLHEESKFATLSEQCVDWGKSINFIFIATWIQTRSNVRVAANMFCVYMHQHAWSILVLVDMFGFHFALKGRGVICETEDCDCKSRNWNHALNDWEKRLKYHDVERLRQQFSEQTLCLPGLQNSSPWTCHELEMI